MLINISTFRIRGTQRTGEKQNFYAVLWVSIQTVFMLYNYRAINYSLKIFAKISLLFDIHMVSSLYVN